MILLHNARIRTLDSSRPSASVLVIDQGRIQAVGGDELLHQFPQAARQDLQGHIVLPGLVDSHIHLQLYILSQEKLDCEVPSMKMILDRVAETVKVARPGEWIVGHGWNQNLWGGNWPSAADLDAVAPANPVYLTAKSLHAGWANSLALKRAKIKKARRDPPEGRIQRDAHGHPTGILFEKAMNMLEAVIPKPHPEDLADIFEKAIPTLWKMGITGVHNFDRETSFRALQILNKRGSLRLRVLQSIPREDLNSAMRLGLKGGMGDDMLRIGPLKLFADGALGPRTAYMIEPYSDAPGNRGMQLMSSREIYDYGLSAASCSIPLAVHAIGDQAVHDVLDAIERLRVYEKEHGLPALRHRIEHLQVVHPQDVRRVAGLDVIASMQPVHAPSDMVMADKAWGSRASLAYAWQTQLSHAARLTFGSDAPVEDPNPFLGMQAAVTRRSKDGLPGPEGWYPAERLTIQQALEAYTLGPAFAAGMENRLGCLAAGYLADLIVLEIDPLECDPMQLSNIKPVATMVAGEWVWQG